LSLSAPARQGLTHPTPRTGFATPSDYFRAPPMPLGARYAIWPRFESAVKPFAFPSLAALARHVHRQRQDRALQLRDEPGHFRDGRRTVVRIDALGAEGESAWLIGYVFLDGRPREALIEALRVHEPEARA
jgi:hypothetical protein